MCGIAGFLRITPIPDGLENLKRQLDTLTHRGPDGEGMFVAGPASSLLHWRQRGRDGELHPVPTPSLTLPRTRGPQVALGIRRLAIVDVAGGHAPALNEDGSITLVMNGQIYNHRELRGRLAHPHQFRTGCDTEVLAHLYEELGIEGVLAQVRGMFAIALWDSHQQKLFLARDPLGKKPLHVARQRTAQGETLWFASEIKGILADPTFQRELDPASLARYLTLEKVPAPQTLFKDITKLLPGHYLEIEARGGEIQVQQRMFWQIPRRGADHPVDMPRASDVQGWQNHMRSQLKQAVTRRIADEVGNAVLLSGGIDSGLIAAEMGRHLPDLTAYTVRFDEPEFDEGGPAGVVARHLGIRHEQILLGVADLPRLVEAITPHFDEPLGDGSLIPTWALAQGVRAAGVTVALGGDGGDEIFAGYPTYLAGRLNPVLDHLPESLRAGALHLLGRVTPTGGNLSWDTQLRLLLEGSRHQGARRHLTWLGSFNPAELQSLLTPEVADAWRKDPHANVWEEVDRWAKLHQKRPTLEQAQLWDLRFYLQDLVLVKADRASMAHHLEVRAPFLDQDLVASALCMPASMRIRGITLKWMLRHLASEVLPPSVVNRPKKGFGMPLARWLRKLPRSLVMSWFEPPPGGQRLVRPERVTTLLNEHLEGQRDHRKVLWTLLSLILWQKSPWAAPIR